MENAAVVGAALAVVAALVFALKWQRDRQARAARGEIPGLEAAVAKGHFVEAAKIALDADRFTEAMDLFLRAGDPTRAAQVAVRIGSHRQAGELYERAGDAAKAAQCYETAGMHDRARELRAPVAPPTNAAEIDPKARAHAADLRFQALRAKHGNDPAHIFEVQTEAQKATDLLLAAGEVARAAEVYRDAEMIDEAVHLFVNVLGTPGRAAPIVLEQGFAERAAELYDMAGEKDQAATVLAGLARKADDPEELAARVVALSPLVGRALLRELTAATGITDESFPLHVLLADALEATEELGQALDVLRALLAEFPDEREVAARVKQLTRALEPPPPPRRAPPPTVAETPPAERAPAPPTVAETPRAMAAPTQISYVTNIIVTGRHGEERALARGLEEDTVSIDALYGAEAMAARIGPTAASLESMIADRPCDLGNIEVYYRLALASLGSGDWARAQACFAAVDDASPGYRDAGSRVLELASWQSSLGRRLSVVGATKPTIPTESAASRYELRGELGRGGMAVVYRAKDTVLGREVALKFLTEELSGQPEMREMFQREARAVAQLNHRNIVTVFDFGLFEGRFFMALELVEGRTIDALITKDGRLGVPDALRITQQVLDALAFAHARQIVHRDIKPSNMMRSDAGLVKVMDFGLAKNLAVQSKNSMIAGTPAYMPPEQFLGVGIDARTDVFAVGATLYEMLSGELPYEGMDRKRAPRPLHEVNPAVPEAVSEAVARALSFDADDRFASAAEFLAPINRAMLGLERVATSPTMAVPRGEAPSATRRPLPPTRPDPRAGGDENIADEFDRAVQSMRDTGFAPMHARAGGAAEAMPDFFADIDAMPAAPPSPPPVAPPSATVARARIDLSPPRTAGARADAPRETTVRNAVPAMRPAPSSKITSTGIADPDHDMALRERRSTSKPRTG